MTKISLRKMNFKERINFYFEDIDTPMGRAFDFVVIALIILVSAIFVIETYDISPTFRRILHFLETAIILIFILEYVLRFWVANRKIRHFFNIYSLVDLLAILPFFFAASHLEFIRVFRIFRFLRLTRFYHSSNVIARLTSRDVFITTRLLFTFFTIIFVSAGLLYHIEQDVNPEQFKTFFDALYFSIITLTTVGFGDITPISQWGKVVTILMILSGLIFIPWQLSDFIKRVAHYDQKT